MGDLNNIMHPNEKWGHSPPSLSRIDNFCSLIKQCGLMDLGYSGPAYTRTNKHFTTHPTFEHLDRYLGDAKWCQAYPSTIVYHLPMLYRDHAPILAIMTLNCPKPNRRFKFLNWCLTEADFHETTEHGPERMVSLCTCIQESSSLHHQETGKEEKNLSTNSFVILKIIFLSCSKNSLIL
jgi:hypothetical protein